MAAYIQVMATDIPPLANLTAIPYIDETGYLPAQLEGKVGVYAIFAADQTLQYIGYSRDIVLSLRQHLVRQPQQCYWLKVQTIERPNRTLLEQIRAAWIDENGSVPPGNSVDQAAWEQPIDVKAAMTPAEQAQYGDPQLDAVAQQKALKGAARRIEAEILALLEARSLQEPLRFNPKLKDQGLLDLK